jgi:hypothetical protein
MDGWIAGWMLTKKKKKKKKIQNRRQHRLLAKAFNVVTE